MPPRIDTLARKYASVLPPEQVTRLTELIRAKARRYAVLNQCPTPADLAARFDHTFVRTPAVDLVSRRLRDTLLTRDGRIVISTPPQELKSTILRWTVFWSLLDNPDRRVVFASYAASLARTSGRIVRGLIETFGPQVGLAVDQSHSDASDWQIAGHQGGMLSVGVGGSLTGRPADVMIIDDPIRNQQDADSPTIRGRLHEWWEAVARTRLAPGAPVIVVQTRWHEDDLAGRRIAEGWPLVNIPAVADGQTPDALGRKPGEYLESTRGRTAEDWEAIRRDVGERVWAALYQGRPAPLEGGIFKREWFDTWRVSELPEGCSPPIVVVDPADNPGDGDEAGIVVGAAHPATRRAYVIDDLSAAMTVGRWARVAALACARYRASTLAFERSLSQLSSRIRETWERLYRQADTLKRTGGDVAAAVERLVGADESPEVREQVAAELAEITGDVDAVLALGQSGPRLQPIRPEGSKQARMLLIASAFETGRVCLVGRFPALEFQAVTWQEGQDSPDRVDALVYLAALLTGTSGVASLGRAQGRIPTRSTALRGRSHRIPTRSTRR